MSSLSGGGVQPTVPFRGSDVTVDSNGIPFPAGYVTATGSRANVTTVASGTISTIDFGMSPCFTFGVRVWLDTNADGQKNNGEADLAGVVVQLLANDSSQIATQSSAGADPGYSYSSCALNLQWNAVYTLSVPNPVVVSGSTYVATTPNVPPLTTGSECLVSGASCVVRPTPPYSPTCCFNTINFGFTPPPLTIGDFVWNDLNANGIQDVGEPGIGGVTLQLFLASNPSSVVSSTTTDVNGVYKFSSVRFIVVVGDRPHIACIAGERFVAQHCVHCCDRLHGGQQSVAAVTVRASVAIAGRQYQVRCVVVVVLACNLTSFGAALTRMVSGTTATPTLRR
jgi:serine-aspartate repeat-containing protein C/D/E